MNYSTTISEFSNLLTGAKSKLELYSKYVNDCDKAIGHKQHILEFNEEDGVSLTYHNFAKIAKDIQILRQERRLAKDVVEAMTPLAEYCERHAQAKNALASLVGDVRRVENYHNSRTYKAKMPDLEGSAIHEMDEVKKGKNSNSKKFNKKEK